jgi:hypothetical protein
MTAPGWAPRSAKISPGMPHPHRNPRGPRIPSYAGA